MGMRIKCMRSARLTGVRAVGESPTGVLTLHPGIPIFRAYRTVWRYNVNNASKQGEVRHNCGPEPNRKPLKASHFFGTAIASTASIW